MASSRIFLPGLTLLLVLFAACSGSSDDPFPSATCSPGQESCDGECVDLLFDRSHCGACGVACDVGEICDLGACVTRCAEGTLRCGDVCVDVGSDAANCGGCGNACADGQVCVDGTCGCPAGREWCDGACVELGTDEAHCGACGNACAEGELCVDGHCMIQCAEGRVECDGVCVDVEADDAHCGGCGNACTGGTACVEGACVCPEGLSLCDGACVDLQSDAAHCGACGAVCAAGENATGAACTDGTCVRTCDAGFADCDGDGANGCEIALDADASNCGACNNVCAEGAYCESGVCCGEAELVCGGACIDPLADDAHCGGCGLGCAGHPNSSGGTCVDGGCELTCVGSFADCNLDRVDGCETDLDSDPFHCGACGNECGSICSEGTCLQMTAPRHLFGTTCVLLSDGGVWCWGLNDEAQVGNGTYQNVLRPHRVPVDPAAEVFAGPYHTCIRTLTGSVVCWGNNENGQLGAGHTNQTSAPVTVTLGADQPLQGVVQLALTGQPRLGPTMPINGSTCALLSSGMVLCWGGGANGRLGNGDTAVQLAPVAVSDGTAPLAGVEEIAAGIGHVCARRGDGTVWCWGSNNQGQLGMDDTTERLYATQVPGLTGVDQIAAAGFLTCARAGGTIKCWGQNTVGQIGDGTTTQRRVPTDVVGITNATDLRVGMNHACALLADSTAKCWGLNSFGQLGDGSITNRSSPVTVLEPLQSGPWTGLRALVPGGQSYTCAVDADDHLWCWGWNNYGQLGDGTTGTSDVPVPIRW